MVKSFDEGLTTISPDEEHIASFEVNGTMDLDPLIKLLGEAEGGLVPIEEINAGIKKLREIQDAMGPEGKDDNTTGLEKGRDTVRVVLTRLINARDNVEVVEL